MDNKCEDRKDIAIVIENLIQFQSIKAGIDELRKKENIDVDIYVPEAQDDQGFKEIFESCYKHLTRERI